MATDSRPLHTIDDAISVALDVRPAGATGSGAGFADAAFDPSSPAALVMRFAALTKDARARIATLEREAVALRAQLQLSNERCARLELRERIFFDESAPWLTGDEPEPPPSQSHLASSSSSQCNLNNGTPASSRPPRPDAHSLVAGDSVATLEQLREIEGALERSQRRVRAAIESRLLGRSATLDRCVICLTRARQCCTLPCAHLASCEECAVSLLRCPMCREAIHQTLRVYPA
jgi:hypothetical protein